MEKRRTPEVIAGRVTGTTGAVIAATADISVQRTGTGTYAVTCPPGFRPVAATVSTITGGNIGYHTTTVGSVVTLAVTNTSAVLTDIDFSFIIVGVQT